LALAFIFDSVGFGEWFVLLAVVLVVVGPNRLPATARKMGQLYARLCRAADGFKRQLLDMDAEMSRAAADLQKEAEDAFRLDGDEASAASAAHSDDALPEQDDGAEAET